MIRDKMKNDFLDFFDRPILGLLAVLVIGFIVTGLSDFFMAGIYLIAGICTVIGVVYKKIKR